MKDNFYELNCENDVINLETNTERLLIENPMFKSGDLLRKIHLKLLQISQHDWQENQHEDRIIVRKQWLSEGKNCEVLHLGATSWKKGKVRIKVTVEFCPDEPGEIQSESPLDDIRKTIL